MDISTLTNFFMWCVILNMGIYLVWAVLCLVLSDFICRIHSKLFSISEETCRTAIYAFLAAYKIVFVAFFLMPYLALLIMGR